MISYNYATAMTRKTVMVSILLSLFVLPGCAIFGGDKAEKKQDESQFTRQDLNEGYSLLYMAVGSLSSTDKAFYVKFESDAVEKVIGDTSDYAAKLQADLERISEDYPAVKIDLDPLPVMEKRKRAAISSDTLKSLAPIVGKSGPAFERKLLLSSAGALVQLEFQCQVMAMHEPVESLRAVLNDAQARFGELYEAQVKLLNEVYFKHNTYEPGKR